MPHSGQNFEAAFVPHEGQTGAEAWALGGRHQGRVLEGARAEARAPDITFRRAILLKAVIRSVR